LRSAYYISDGTAITAEVFGHALLSLFTIQFEHITVPFVETIEQAQEVIQKISESFQDDGQRPLVFYTIVNIEVRKIVSK
jgi:regulator of PEP synthase PpsR (kinase-PPPase family)